jgi:iron-sulfur cluster protein
VDKVKNLPPLRVEKALVRFKEHFLFLREKVKPEFNLQELRKEIRSAKRRVSADLKEAIKEFSKNAEAKGAKVYYAKDKKEALKRIFKICKELGAERIVKTKSMATEELGLNHFLEKKGLKVVETDLGEWIVQLSGEKPSHILAPAIHLTRNEVAELFSKHFGKVPPQPEALVKVARRELRKEFLSADLGICGANIAICETGSLVIFTNEGNGRLVLNLPRALIAVVPVDKLVFTKEEALAIVRALPKSATGQILSSYVSFITGSPISVNGEKKPVYIILLDNGRSKAARDPEFKKAFYCIRCGACANVCPVFISASGFVFGKIYTGPIGVVLTAITEGIEEASKIAELCLGCKRCEEMCPAGVPLSELILEIKRRKAPTFKEKSLFLVFKKQERLERLWRLGKAAYGPIKIASALGLVPFLKNRRLPKLPETTFTSRLSLYPQEAYSKKVGFFPGCLVEFLYPDFGEALIKLLNACGIGVEVPSEMVCCGAPIYYSGENPLKNALINLEALSGLKVEKILSLCPTCTLMLKKLPEILSRGKIKGKKLELAEEFSEKVEDATVFLLSLVEKKALSFKGEVDLKVSYHDPCHLRRSLGIFEEPRKLISLAGVEFVEMKDPAECCGMAGSYAFKHPEISMRIFARRAEAFNETSASLLLTSCPACVFQWETLLKAYSSSAKVDHLVAFLARHVRL